MREEPEISCLILTVVDPVSGRPRTGSLLRYENPPDGVRYSMKTERLFYPRLAGYYKPSLPSFGLGATKFFLEHALSFRAYRGHPLIHSFFWDLRRFDVPWIHESDQSLGQYLDGYIKVGSAGRRAMTRVFAAYLNSRGCKGVVVWSKWAKDGYIQEGVDASKVHVIPPPFPPVFDRRPHDGCNVLFIGRDYARKGGREALDAFEALSRFQDARLMYVGRVDDGEALARMRRSKRVVHYPNPSQRVLAQDIFPVADVFLLPTRADAFALTVVEAMSRGIPVVVSALPAISEVVESGRSGYLVEAGDVGGFVRRLSLLTGDERARAQMGEEARKRAGSLFSRETINRSLKRVYSDAG